MNAKGFFFTIDAMLGIAIIATLLGAVLIFGMSEHRSGAETSMLQSWAMDDALKEFLKGGSTKDSVAAGKITAACEEIYEYGTNGAASMKVRKCKMLG